MRATLMPCERSKSALTATFFWRPPCALSSCGIACERRKPRVALILSAPLRKNVRPARTGAAEAEAEAVAVEAVEAIGIAEAIANGTSLPRAAAADRKMEAATGAVVVVVVVAVAAAETEAVHLLIELNQITEPSTHRVL